VNSELKRLVSLANLHTVVIDFEKAAMNAFIEVYPDATITGCYLHQYTSEHRSQSQRDRTENGLRKQRRISFIRLLSSRACFRPARRHGVGVRASG